MKTQSRQGMSDKATGFLFIAWLLGVLVVMPLLCSLRVGGVIDTDWLWIFAPLWVPFFVALFFVLCAVVFMAGIYWLGGIVRVKWDEES